MYDKLIQERSVISDECEDWWDIRIDGVFLDERVCEETEERVKERWFITLTQVFWKQGDR